MDPNTDISFVINLKDQPEKWDRSLSALTKNGFNNVERVEGVYGKDIKDFEDAGVSVYARHLVSSKAQRCSHALFDTPGAIGCYLSHVACWQNIVDRNLPGAFIFEDDISFLEDFQTKFKQINLLNSDVLLFGYLDATNCIPINDTVKTCKFGMGTQAYYVTQQGAMQLLKYYLPIEIHVDHYIILLSLEKKITLLHTTKSLVNQNNLTVSRIGHSKCIKCILPDSPIFYLGMLLLILGLIITVIYLLMIRK